MKKPTKPITPAQRRACELILKATEDAPSGWGSVYPAQLARLMWPDSAAWGKRTRKFGGKDPGAMGGTMPMKAGSLLYRMEGAGLVMQRRLNDTDYSWQLTTKGEQVARGEL